MRIATTVIGVLMIVMGGIWFLQGINVLPGSFMTGQVRWAVYGGILAALTLSGNICARVSVPWEGESHVLHKMRDRA